MCGNKTPTRMPVQLERDWEDFHADIVYQLPLVRTISETEPGWITTLTCNTDQHNTNTHLVQSNPSTRVRITVDSGMTVALALGFSLLDMGQDGNEAVTRLPGTKISPLDLESEEG